MVHLINENDLQIPPRTLCEVINGQHFMSPSPFAKHQIIVTDLLTDRITIVEKQK